MTDSTRAKAKDGRPAYRYRIIADRLQRHIVDTLHPGDLMPSERELAARHSVNVRTIRQALDELSIEGYITRYPRRGSVVADRHATGELAVVLRPQLLSAESHPYYSKVIDLLFRHLQQVHARWQIRLHMGQVVDEGHLFPATLDLLAPDVLRNLRGVFTFHPLYDVEARLRAAHVPVVGLHAKQAVRVWFDYDSTCSQGVARLKAAGCRHVGLMWPFSGDRCTPRHPVLAGFQKSLRANGLVSRSEWMEPWHVDEMTEQSGYEAMIRFWERRPRPDGILVVDDIMCRGVLRAALRLGIAFPDDLRLVTQANRGIALNYHRPVTRVEFNLDEQVRLAVDMMFALLDGRSVAPASIDLPGVLVEGATA